MMTKHGAGHLFRDITDTALKIKFVQICGIYSRKWSDTVPEANRNDSLICNCEPVPEEIDGEGE